MVNTQLYLGRFYKNPGPVYVKVVEDALTYIYQLRYLIIKFFAPKQSTNVRGRADCTALPWGNGIYCKLKLKREQEEIIIKLKYLNKYGERQ